jgi:lipid-A-disaccharide synthase
MHIAVTANGPGEVAGWVRPLLRALYARRPDLDVTIFLVPDDYASGYEGRMLREFFPNARVVEPKNYLKLALGARRKDLPPRIDVLQYIGGDLMHAALLHRRLHGRTATYKFSRRRYRRLFDRAFAVDARNAGELQAWGTPPERIEIVGNLAIDGALHEAALPPEPGTPDDGILFMPGSRAYEVENLVPFYFAVALRILNERPVPMAFALSPFTAQEQVRGAIERGGHPRMFGRTGRLLFEEGRECLATADGTVRIPVLRNGLAAARRARLVLTIPGTKTIELAVLGKPAIAMTPLNAPELVTINGPLTYLARIPAIGVALKRAAAVAVSRRHTFHTQPNIDAGRALIREMHGTVTPGRVARVALDSYDDAAWLAESSAGLAELYRSHVGASDRMADALLRLAA